MFERRWPAFCTEVVSSRSILEKGWFKFRGVSWILNVSGMFAGRHAETKRFARIPSGVKRLKDLFNLMCILQYVHLSVQLAMITSVFAPELSFDKHNRYSHNPKSRVRPHSYQLSTGGSSSSGQSVQAALPALGDPVVAPSTEES